MVLFTAVIYYSSRTHSKISKGNRAWRDPQGIQARASQGPQWALDSKGRQRNVAWSESLGLCHKILLLTFLFQASWMMILGQQDKSRLYMLMEENGKQEWEALGMIFCKLPHCFFQSLMSFFRVPCHVSVTFVCYPGTRPCH